METLTHSPVSSDVEHVNELLSQVIHDINNPLAVISGNAQFLTEMSEVMPLEPVMLKALDDINEAVLTLNERLAQLLQLSTALEQQEV